MKKKNEERFDAISPRGSLWHRWDPHIHAPGTALNDQYTGPNPWDSFFKKLEEADPSLRAIGITDYYGLDCYVEAVERRRKDGRLPGVGLIFPNIEFRLSIETSKGGAVNLHLLFSPHDSDHVDRIRRFLNGLEFRYSRETFRCNREDLIRLGRVHNSKITNDTAAYREGVLQFKVTPDQVIDAYKDDPWLQKNALIAVAGTSRDGTSGLQGDGGQWEATRKKIERAAHIIFSTNPRTIDFFLGKGSANLDELNDVWGGRKPCLHGSDSHGHDRIALPDGDRRCWLKGDLTFETLRQVVIEPEGRAYIGASPPRGALPGNCIEAVEVSNAPWMRPTRVPVNGGMVAIIGARGSGKTALADFIATGGFGVSSQLSKSSFLRRAAEFLTGSHVTLSWEAGTTTANGVGAIDAEDLFDAPHVQYLSQQFVEQLCSSEGLHDKLVEEIQRVIFNAHPEGERLGAEGFTELLSLRLQAAREARERQREALERTVESITAEQLRKDGLNGLHKEHDEKAKVIDKDKRDRQLLVPKGQEQRAMRLEAVSTAYEAKQRAVSSVKLKLQALASLQNDVDDFRGRRARDWVDDLKDRRADAGLSTQDWDAFGVQFTGDIDSLLKSRIGAARVELATLEGLAASDPTDSPAPDPAVSLIPDTADLNAQTLRLLERERNRLQRQVGIDEQNARRYKMLSEKIANAEKALHKLKLDIERAGKSDQLLKSLREQRKQAYRGVFDAVIEEEEQLKALYAPLMSRIAGESVAVSRLSFTVRRIVDLGTWTSRGQALLDLRTGPFRGLGELQRAAEATLAEAWTRGTAESVSEAMTEFVTKYGTSLKEHMPAKTNYREWVREVTSWLYNTDHIHVGYGLQYDGEDIEHLSPGTRGIVLLMLYLAIDSDDDRPLIIDQPEENLDPQSVFRDLVPVFSDAKRRRQIIIVTHNANLVVNTDVDQVIVARCGPHRPGQLPEITYDCGGLENTAIRDAVCQILEGGECAFRERARRLRVVM